MEEFPSNSHKSKEPEVKKIEPVVTGKVVRQKKPLGRRFLETFAGGGDAKTVIGYVFLDVLVPAAKDMMADAVSQGVERMLFGEVRSASRRSGGFRPGSGPNGYVSYNRYASGSSRQSPAPRDDRREISRRSRANFDFDEIILATRAEAEEVVDRLFDLVSRYEVATVADLYELVGVAGSYVDNKWGWTDIRGAGVTRVRNGYLLDLPRPEPIE